MAGGSAANGAAGGAVGSVGGVGLFLPLPVDQIGSIQEPDAIGAIAVHLVPVQEEGVESSIAFPQGTAGALVGGQYGALEEEAQKFKDFLLRYNLPPDVAKRLCVGVLEKLRPRPPEALENLAVVGRGGAEMLMSPHLMPSPIRRAMSRGEEEAGSRPEEKPDSQLHAVMASPSSPMLISSSASPERQRPRVHRTTPSHVTMLRGESSLSLLNRVPDLPDDLRSLLEFREWLSRSLKRFRKAEPTLPNKTLALMKMAISYQCLEELGGRRTISVWHQEQTPREREPVREAYTCGNYSRELVQLLLAMSYGGVYGMMASHASEEKVGEAAWFFFACSFLANVAQIHPVVFISNLFWKNVTDRLFRIFDACNRGAQRCHVGRRRAEELATLGVLLFTGLSLLLSVIAAVPVAATSREVFRPLWGEEVATGLSYFPWFMRFFLVFSAMLNIGFLLIEEVRNTADAFKEMDIKHAGVRLIGLGVAITAASFYTAGQLEKTEDYLRRVVPSLDPAVAHIAGNFSAVPLFSLNAYYTVVGVKALLQYAETSVRPMLHAFSRFMCQRCSRQALGEEEEAELRLRPVKWYANKNFILTAVIVAMMFTGYPGIAMTVDHALILTIISYFCASVQNVGAMTGARYIREAMGPQVMGEILKEESAHLSNLKRRGAQDLKQIRNHSEQELRTVGEQREELLCGCCGRHRITRQYEQRLRGTIKAAREMEKTGAVSAEYLEAAELMQNNLKEVVEERIQNNSLGEKIGQWAWAFVSYPVNAIASLGCCPRRNRDATPTEPTDRTPLNAQASGARSYGATSTAEVRTPERP